MAKFYWRNNTVVKEEHDETELSPVPSQQIDLRHEGESGLPEEENVRKQQLVLVLT